jgi:hypothetical protein
MFIKTGNTQSTFKNFPRRKSHSYCYISIKIAETYLAKQQFHDKCKIKKNSFEKQHEVGRVGNDLFQSPSNPITSHLIKSFHITSNQLKTSWVTSQQHAPRPHKLRHFKIHQIISYRIQSSHIMLNRYTLSWINSL